MNCRKETLQKIGSFNSQTGSVDAGMAANVGMSLNHILVNDQLNLILVIIHQAQNAHRAGSKIKILFQIFWTGKGKSGAADLVGKVFGFKFFWPGHEKKVETGFLGVG